MALLAFAIVASRMFAQPAGILEELESIQWTLPLLVVVFRMPT